MVLGSNPTNKMWEILVLMAYLNMTPLVRRDIKLKFNLKHTHDKLGYNILAMLIGNIIVL